MPSEGRCRADKVGFCLWAECPAGESIEADPCPLPMPKEWHDQGREQEPLLNEQERERRLAAATHLHHAVHALRQARAAMLDEVVPLVVIHEVEALMERLSAKASQQAGPVTSSAVPNA